MPKTKRISIPVDPKTEQALGDYADALGITKPQLVGQILKESAPNFSKMAKAVRLAKDYPAAALRAAQKIADATHAKTNEVLRPDEEVNRQAG